MLYKEKKILCTICARGGSKGVPLKNLQDLGGIPLIAHSICQAQEANCFSKIVVSSDSDDILEVSEKFGADILIKRPAQLATDVSGKLPVIIHCANEVERLTSQTFDIFVDLDATAPLRIPNDILNAIDLLLDTAADNVISGCKSKKSPYFNLVEKTPSGIVKLPVQMDEPILRRQDSPICFDLNGSIYVWNREILYNSTFIFNNMTKLYEMPEERGIDIDTPLDLEFVRFLFKRKIDLGIKS